MVDLDLSIVEIDGVARPYVYCAERKTHIAAVDQVEIDQPIKSGLERRGIVEAKSTFAAIGCKVWRRQAWREKARNAKRRDGGGAQIIEHRAKRIKYRRWNDRGHRRNAIPEFAQSFDAPLRRVAGDQCGIDGADRYTGDPVGYD